MPTRPIQNDTHAAITTGDGLAPGARNLVLLTAFAGWLFAGMQMGLNTLALRDAAIDLLHSTQEQEALVARWWAWFGCALLFGAAAGGMVFGWIGDRFGRAKAMGLSVVWFSVMSGLAYFTQGPMQLLLLRFLAGIGVGGLWPNAVALVSEAWPNSTRPMVSGIIGTAATAGIAVISAIGMWIDIRPGDWRWVMLVGASPIVLGLFILLAVPESPRWLAQRTAAREVSRDDRKNAPVSRIFHQPLLPRTLLGILLATVPMIGGWGSSNWLVPWAGQVGAAAKIPNYSFKAATLLCRATTGMCGTLIGGWLASRFGRRSVYFVMSAASLLAAEYLFSYLSPADHHFLLWVGVVGFFSTMYYGWLPFYLPELFPTLVRATGTGVSFNFGRILTAAAMLGSGGLMMRFAINYAQIGALTSLIFAVGMVVILFAPDTAAKQLED